MPDTIPMTVIGGFLGAGKTTLLNHILRGSHGVRFTVLVNDFGDLAIDGNLIREHGGDTLTFANGCVCCTLGDNFMATLNRLLASPSLTAPQAPQQILIEASGVADPRAIADIAVLHPRLRRDLILILADAASIRDRAADERLADTVERQLAAADLIVLNKCDLVDADERAALRQWLNQRTPAAIIKTRHADLPLAWLADNDVLARDTDHRPVHGHGVDFTSVTLPVESLLDLEPLRQRLPSLPRSVLRAKGFVKIQQGGLYLLQLSGQVVDISEWTQSDSNITPALVFIGTQEMPGADELRRLLFGDSLSGIDKNTVCG